MYMSILSLQRKEPKAMTTHGNLVYCAWCLDKIGPEVEHIDRQERHYHEHCSSVAAFRTDPTRA